MYFIIINHRCFVFISIFYCHRSIGYHLKKKTVAATKKTAVVAKKTAAGNRAKKLAVVKKKAAKRMTELAKRSDLHLRNLENRRKRLDARMANDNITEEDLLL